MLIAVEKEAAKRAKEEEERRAREQAGEMGTSQVRVMYLLQYISYYNHVV